MEYQDILPLVNQFNNKMNEVDLTFKRYLHDKINWKARLIGIKGARGVGKSTLLLQHIKESLVEYLYTHGFTHLFLDEVHKLDQWSRYIKNIYDSYPQLHIVYTGSSMLEIDHSKVDLSRRQMLYTMHGLSFREYLEFEGLGAFPVVSIEDLLGSHLPIAMKIVSQTRVLQYFDRYLQSGYYPFYKDSISVDDFHSRLREVANVVVESDMPAVEEITYTTVQKAKQLLMVIAPNVPLQPNISRLSQELEVTPSQCLKILYLLDRAGLLLLLTKEQKDYKHLAKPGKIFLGNGNLMYALSSVVNLGTCRGQIANIPDSYLAVDDVEIGHLNRIPLWMFGMLY